MFGQIYDYFFSEPKSEEYKARYKYLTTISSYELVEASLPVFVAAGIAGSASDIITVLGEEKENMEVILTLLYALFMYVIGKTVTYYLLKDEETPSQSKLFSTLREYKLSKLLRHSFAELSGFAWKEFFIILCLKEIYRSDGFGASFGSWLLIIAVALSFIKLSSFVQRKVLNFDQAWNQKLLLFDTDAFALSIAYVFTVLLALGGFEIGFGYIRSNQIIFEWNEDFDSEHEDSASAGVPTAFLYAGLVAMIVALAQVEEDEEDFDDELCIVRESYLAARPSTSQNIESGGASSNAVAASTRANMTGAPQNDTSTINPMSKSSFEYDNGTNTALAAATAAGNEKAVVVRVLDCMCDQDAARSSTFLWNEFLGYTAGISYFLVVFTVCDVGEKDDLKIIPALFIALLCTYRGPSLLAKLKITREELLAKEGEKAQILSTGDDSAPDSTGNGGGGFWCTRLTAWVNSLYSDMRLKRKSVMMVSVRLTVGWVWETVLADAFELMGDTDSLKPVARVLVEVAFAAVIIAIVLAVHLYVRDWASDGILEEQQRTQRQTQQAAAAGGGQVGSQAPPAITAI